MGAIPLLHCDQDVNIQYQHHGQMSLKTKRLTVTKVNVASFSPGVMMCVFYQNPIRAWQGKGPQSFTVFVNDLGLISGTTIFSHDPQSCLLIVQT